MYYIYKFENRINQKVYIGSTINFKKRKLEHKYASMGNSNVIFHRAIRKYGLNNFDFEVLAIVLKEKDVDEVEQWFIDHFQSMYNQNGYNSVGVLKGSRELISRIMKKEWKDPKKRKIRLKKIKEGSRKKSIIRVSIYDGSYQIYESVHEAIRDGYSTFGIYENLNNKTKTGQENCWFYYDKENPDIFVSKTKERIGEFKIDYFKPIIATNKITGEQIHFKNTFELKGQGFKPKAVRRVLRGEREGYAGYYWKYSA